MIFHCSYSESKITLVSLKHYHKYSLIKTIIKTLWKRKIFPKFISWKKVQAFFPCFHRVMNIHESLRTRKSCGNNARGRAVKTPRVEELWKQRAWESCGNTARGRAVQTPRVEECCILVFSLTPTLVQFLKFNYNENFILATDIIFDNVSMHSWQSNLILTTLVDNGFITCAKRSYKLAENLGRRHWTERLTSNSVNSTSIQNILFHVATVLLNRKVTITFFLRGSIFSMFSVFTHPRVIVNSHRYLFNHFSRL